MPGTDHPRPPALLALLLLAGVFGLAACPAAAQSDPLPPAPPSTARPAPADPLAPAPAIKPGAEAPAAPKAPSAEAAAADADAAQEAQRVAACKAHALAILKPRSPSIDDIFIDMDGLTIAKADAKVGSAHVTGVLMGEAYIQRDRSDQVHRFLCLTGKGDEVLLTFFTER